MELDGISPMQTNNLLSSLSALLYLQITVKGQAVLDLLDSGACNNFISEALVQRLGLVKKSLRKKFIVRSASGADLAHLCERLLILESLLLN